MKELGAIRHQIKQVSFRHLKKRLETGLRPRPTNCVHNRIMQHPDLIAAQKGPCGVCVCPQQEGDVLCDPAWGGVEKAKDCSYFETITNKEAIKAEFKSWLSTAQLHEIAAEYPDLAALLWVCQDDAPNREVEIDDEDWEPETHTAEVFEVVFADVTLRIASAEDAETVRVEIAGMMLAIEAANALNKTREGELEAAEATCKRLQTDIDDKTRDHKEASNRVAELEWVPPGPELPAPRVSWWTRMFGGTP